MFTVNDAGIVKVAGGPTGAAAFAFVVGFSEAAFLSLITKIGGSTGPPAKHEAVPPSGSKNRTSLTTNSGLR